MGSLAKIQLKAYDGNGDLLYTNNVSGISAPAVVVPLASFDRGQALDIQANIRNVDNTRTDVVSVTAVGKLRPDLAVLHVDAPSNAPLGMPVHITATIVELNHDTGARATCVLSVDDRPVDRAEGIWVDAGDTVSCAFARAFTSGGLHQFQVDVTDVNPGVIENLFASDLAYLQTFYNEINANGVPKRGVVCPECEARFEVDLEPVGES